MYSFAGDNELTGTVPTEFGHLLFLKKVDLCECCSEMNGLSVKFAMLYAHRFEIVLIVALYSW